MSTLVSAPHRRPAGLRLLLVVLFAIPAVAVLGFAAIYLAAFSIAGDHATLVGTPIDPKDGIPLGYHWWNPFTWLFNAVVLAITMWPLAGLAVITGVANLARPSVRADRRTTVLLAAAVVCCAAYLAVLFHPATDALLGWFAD